MSRLRSLSIARRALHVNLAATESITNSQIAHGAGLALSQRERDALEAWVRWGHTVDAQEVKAALAKVAVQMPLTH